MAFNGEKLNRARVLGGYEGKDFSISRIEDSYLTQVLQPFVRTIRQAGQAGRVLDLASGGGETANFFRQSGLQVVQLDLSPFALERAQGARVLGSAEKPPFLDTTFDAIHMKDGIVHIGDINGLFGEMVRLLVPGGKVLITSTPVSWNENSFRVWRKESDGTEKDEQVVFDTPDDYNDKVRSLLQDTTVSRVAPPHYPRSSDQVKAAAAANQLAFKQESSWTSTTRQDWYERHRQRFVLQFEKPIVGSV